MDLWGLCVRESRKADLVRRVDPLDDPPTTIESALADDRRLPNRAEAYVRSRDCLGRREALTVRIKEERDRAAYAFDARNQAIGRIGLPAVRQFRRRRLQSEYEARLAALDDMKSSVPELNAVAMVRIDATAGKTSERAS